MRRVELSFCKMAMKSISDIKDDNGYCVWACFKDEMQRFMDTIVAFCKDVSRGANI
ncbi:MAG: hypothetical protein JEZ01_20980 [Labilibaculum sp.]|nr:hypothetical protein [Labilibaculum sp.]MBI9060254.1 hypothetical protein [Labilibaculum sp.]